MIMKIIGLLILIIFYTVYIGKMLQQKQKGIRTNQIAKGGKSKDVMRIELLMKIATYGIIVVEIISIAVSKAKVPTPLSVTGICFGVTGDLFFFWAVYTMRDSWRAGIPANDRTEIVTSGIYGLSRNPAFLGFDLVYTGILVLFFNWLHLAFVVFAMVMLHLQILQEEKFLAAVFGKEYPQYQKRVCRYIGVCAGN